MSPLTAKPDIFGRRSPSTLGRWLSAIGRTIVRIRRLLAAFFAALLLPMYAANAQGGKVRKVGVILQGGSWYQVVEGLREGLKDLGFEEGKQFVLDIRDMHGELKAVEQEARSLEQQQVALIYTLSTSVSMAAKRGTERTPIVFVAGTNPVVVDLVETIRRPGGRLTGVQFRATDLTGKRLELLLEIAPKVRRIVAFYDPQNPSARESAHEAREAAHKLGLELTERHVGSVSQLLKVVEAFKGDDADAVPTRWWIATFNTSSIWPTFGNYPQCCTIRTLSQRVVLPPTAPTTKRLVA
jgi:putative tryptophan/tyrosine transport system substrate-binding protein